MTNKYAGKCNKCGGRVNPGAGTVEKGINGWIISHVECPEITSGLGIGGTGSDDYNIGNADGGSIHDQQYFEAHEGEHVYPAGTTQGYRTPGKKCERCGQPADYNPNAGQHLCRRHWDSY